MKSKSEMDAWWIDSSGVERAQINAVYNGGVFIDQDTGQPINVKEGSSVKILVGTYAMSDDRKEHHNRVEQVKLLENCSELFFRFRIQGEGEREFKVVLRGDLIIERRGNKSGKLSYVPCDVFDAKSGELIVSASSLNEAYTRTSAKLRPDARTHTANAFKVFYYKYDSLEQLRPF